MYSYTIPEDKKDMYAMARAEDVEASYKDLAEVCGRIRNKNCAKAVVFLEMASEGIIPVMFKRHNKKLGHRRELGGAKGRYPMKAAKAVLKALNSAIANSRVKGLGEELIIVHACANKLHEYPRMSPKGRRFRQDYSTSRIEIVVKEKVELPSDERKRRREAVKEKAKPETPKAETAEKAEVKTEAKQPEKKAEEKTDKPHAHEDKKVHSAQKEKKSRKQL
jgi:large subunit ribosomal protein L22